MCGVPVFAAVGFAAVPAPKVAVVLSLVAAGDQFLGPSHGGLVRAWIQPSASAIWSRALSASWKVQASRAIRLRSSQHARR